MDNFQGVNEGQEAEAEIRQQGISPDYEAMVADMTPSMVVAIETQWYGEGVKLQQYAESRIIKTPDDMKLANDDLTIIARLKKAMEERRKELVKPLKDEQDRINADYKSLMAPVLDADRITRDKMLGFNAEQERIRREQEEINRKRIEAAEAEMKLKGEMTEPLNLVEVVPEPPRRVSTEMGTSGTIKVRKWRLVDIAKVPPEFLLVDAGKVTKLVKAGIGSIAGIEIYEEDTLRVNTR